MPNVFQAFADAAGARRSGLFIQDGDRRYSYADMLDGSARAAGALREAGIGRGDRIVVQVEKSVRAVLLYLACLRAGIVYIPLNTAYRSEEVRYFLEDAAPALFVCTAAMRGALAEERHIPPGLETLTLEEDESGSLADAMDAARPDEVIAVCAEDDVAAILYTSGTTGRSKGAMLTHRNLLSNVAVLAQAWRWQDDDVLVHALPIFHAHGLFVALHLSLYRATPILFHRRFDVGPVLADLARATVFMGVPTFYVRLLKQEEFTRAHVAAMRLFVSGSAPLTEPVFAAFADRTGQRILERYGMTEALMITSNAYAAEGRVAGSVGFPLPDISARLARESEPGQPGVLEIKGPNVFSGYWRQADKTRDAFTDDGWFRTGDIATIDGDGRVRLVGRGSDLIISGGYNVYPKEVEMLIDDLDGVEEAAVIGVPHPDFGEAMVAIVVAGAAGIAPDAIRQALRGRIADFKMPKRVIVVDALPRNAMSKVEKAALRRRYADLFA